jgi:hypothetical protein
MLAVVGYVVPEFYRFSFDIAPGLACANVPNGVAAIDAIPALGWAQIFFAIGSVDYYGFLGDFDSGKPALDANVLETRKLQELQRKFIQEIYVLLCLNIPLHLLLPFRRTPCHACHP